MQENGTDKACMCMAQILYMVSGSQEKFVAMLFIVLRNYFLRALLLIMFLLAREIWLCLMARIILVAGLMEKEMVMETWCFLMAILISVSGAITCFMVQVHTNTPRSMLYIKANGLKDYSMAMAITKI